MAWDNLVQQDLVVTQELAVKMDEDGLALNTILRQGSLVFIQMMVWNFKLQTFVEHLHPGGHT